MNDSIEITIKAACRKCGHDDFTASEGDPPDTPTFCTRCGADNGTIGEVMASLHDQLHDEVAKQTKALERHFRDLFR